MPHSLLVLFGFLSAALLAFQRDLRNIAVYSWAAYASLLALAALKGFSARSALASLATLGFLSVLTLALLLCSKELGRSLRNIKGLYSSSPSLAWTVAVTCYALSMLPPFAPFILEETVINALQSPLEVFALEVSRLLLLLGYLRVATSAILREEGRPPVKPKYTGVLVFALGVLTAVSVFAWVIPHA